LTDRIRYEGTEVNPKRIYRLYCEEGLQLPRRRRKKLRSLKRQPLPAADGVNSRWSMDFVHDMLADSRRFRALNVLDDCSRESLAIEVATSIPGKRVTRVLDHVAAQRGYPTAIVMDNGPEFTGRALDRWAAEHGVQLHFIDPGKPTQNAFVESFNDKFRSECLNTNWFVDLEDARVRIEKWRREYNELRPHSSIGRIPPAEFTRRAAALRGPAAPFGLLLDPPGTEGKREHFVAQSLDQ
jgi:putative transposase